MQRPAKDRQRSARARHPRSQPFYVPSVQGQRARIEQGPCTGTDHGNGTSVEVDTRRPRAPRMPEQHTSLCIPEQHTSLLIPEQHTRLLIPEQHTSRPTPEQHTNRPTIKQHTSRPTPLFYCKPCRRHFRGNRAAHQASKGHQEKLTYLLEKEQKVPPPEPHMTPPPWDGHPSQRAHLH